ncbi:ABC transporter permease [Hahella ganghwensis]|uniref:ABC transporter permease n=1 Tax=Hahella ganghwensis TaxID=286420 RepID=UPI0003751738|nr:ABC transporter permease [Hahella ganghwensis]
MAGALISSLSSGLALAKRNIRIQVQEHALGYAWTLIIPVLYATCYVFIKRELSGGGSVSETDGWDIIRAFGGITLFHCWIQIVRDMSEIVTRNRGMLRGLSVGLSPFVLAILYEGVLALIIRGCLIAAAIPILGLEFPSSVDSWMIIFSCFAILHLTAAAIGLFLAPWASLYGDVKKAIQSINLPMVLVSPILYPAVSNVESWMYWVNIVNPLASPLATLNSALQDATGTPYLLPMLIWGATAVLMIVILVAMLKRQVPVLLERIG